jgi:hypothetical protein
VSRTSTRSGAEPTWPGRQSAGLEGGLWVVRQPQAEQLEEPRHRRGAELVAVLDVELVDHPPVVGRVRLAGVVDLLVDVRDVRLRVAQPVDRLGCWWRAPVRHSAAAVAAPGREQWSSEDPQMPHPA